MVVVSRLCRYPNKSHVSLDAAQIPGPQAPIESGQEAVLVALERQKGFDAVATIAPLLWGMKCLVGLLSKDPRQCCRTDWASGTTWTYCKVPRWESLFTVVSVVLVLTESKKVAILGL